ncbi:phosphotyrosine-specific ptp2-like protein, partial [Dipsacomyces acuminosporus]
MRQPPGGNGFNPSEIVPMRLPPDFATKGNQMDKLPDYLRRTADPKSGPQLLYRLFKCIDASETKRMTSMIHNNGMVTDDNQFTISAGLELGSKNRYNNIFPFDNNRVRLRSIRRAQTSIDPTMATTTTSTAAAAAIPTFIGQRRASDKSAMGSTAAAMEVSLGSLSKKKLGERPQSLGIAAINKLPHLADDQQLHMKRSSQRIVSKTENMLPPIDDNEESDFHDSSTEATARHNDYVNASYISYFDGPLYIATQGPLPDTVYDFWKMVWEHHSLVIVMLTQEHENGRSKCHHYWPNKLGEESQYGDLVVKWEAEAEHPDDSSVVARRFMLSRPTITDETVHITHLQYIGWSDHGVPENPLGVLRLRQLARKAQEDGEKANRKAKSRIPMVVHCSAGCGRTGAFCAIDTILSMQERQSTSDGKSTKTNVDCDGDTIMSTGIQGPSNMQMLPGGATHSAYDEFTGLVPQALRSQSSGDSLKSNGGIVLATPNRKSLKEWSELPPEEFHEDLVFMIVSRFRELRVTMVQTNRQFVFCHEALAWHALGNGPRSIDRIIDPRLVFEWNKANYPDLKEEDCKDLTFLLRGWHEMVKAMTESAERINNSNKGENGSVTIGRASIDVSSVGKLLHANRLSISPEIALKRSNTIGVAKRGFFGSLFKSLTSGSGGSSDDMDIDQSEEKSGKSIDVHIKDTGDSSGQQQQHSLQTAAMPATAVPPQTPMVGSFFADRPSAPMPPQTPMVGSFFANPLPSSSSSAALPPAPLPKTPMVGSFFANPPQKELPAIPTDNPLVANMGFRNRQRRPPNLTLSISNENQSQDMWSKPRVKGVETPGPRSGMGSGSTQGSGYYEPGSSVYTPLPPPLRTTAITEAHQKANDYFGISTCSNSPGAGAEGVSASPHLSATNNDAVSIASQQESVGLLDLFVNPPSSTAADWRRSVLGRLDLGNINFDALSPDAQQQRRSFAQDAAGSPYSYQGHRHEEFHTPLPQPPATATVPARP